MTTLLTTRELFDAARELGPRVEAMTKVYEEASLALITAKERYELAEADAFLEAKRDGATDEMAKRIALIKASKERREVQLLTAQKAAARLGSDKFQSFLDAYSAISHTLNRELKTFHSEEQFAS
jgi:hypothetical protein